VPQKLSASENTTRSTSSKEAIELPDKLVDTLIISNAHRGDVGTRSTTTTATTTTTTTFIITTTRIVRGAITYVDANGKHGGVVVGNGVQIVMM
jgi:hypothetical protein